MTPPLQRKRPTIFLVISLRNTTIVLIRLFILKNVNSNFLQRKKLTEYKKNEIKKAKLHCGEGVAGIFEVLRRFLVDF